MKKGMILGVLAVTALAVASLAMFATPASAGPPLPDLEIDNVYSGPGNPPAVGAKVSFKVVVHNDGTANAGPRIEVEETIAGVTAGTCRVATQPKANTVIISGSTTVFIGWNTTLAPSQSVVATINCTATGAMITKTGEVDPDNEVAEDDELNNTDSDLSDDPLIPPAALAEPDLEIDNSGPATVPGGGTASFSVQVRNTGTASAGPGIYIAETLTGVVVTTCVVTGGAPPPVGSANIAPDTVLFSWPQASLGPGNTMTVAFDCDGTPSDPITKCGEVDASNNIVESDELNNEDCGLADDSVAPNPPVGGVGELPGVADAGADAALGADGGGGLSTGAYAGIAAAIAAGALALGAGGLYARRRRMTR